MASLYEAGWRQGSILDAALPLSWVSLDEHGQPEVHTLDHRGWVVATQDCDLAQTGEAGVDPIVELRPMYTADPPSDWGIRSARLLVADGRYLVSASPRLQTSAATLTTLLATGAGRKGPDDDRRLALKTWLGLRYDRPAVPEVLVPLAKAIGTAVKALRKQEVVPRVRDVLIQFSSDDPPRFSLFAVLQRPDDQEQVRRWLADVAQGVPVTLGVADQIEAATAAGISWELVETSYSADVSQITWRPGNPGPEGAA